MRTPPAADRLPERRPIAARDWGASRRAAGWLARRGVSPNAISVVGMVCGVAASGALALTSAGWGWSAWLAAAALIQLRLLANMLDGMVAVAAGRRTRLGELFNELPDRISDAAILIGLGYAAGGVPELGYLAAVAALLTAYVRALGKTAGAPAVFAGPMAKQHRMAVVTLAAVACAVLPNGWAESYHVAGWVAGACLAGTVVTVARRLVLIARHLREARP
ncbi:MAG TPA: CDP-alcohol phosphatidyltransferase family protein [Fimbriiglobus sp.]|nr:CDP-alcohol phosphatidyltransferase family protein [Fimbriiglobus sp.]